MIRDLRQTLPPSLRERFSSDRHGAATLTWAGIVTALTGPAAEAIRTSLFAWWPAQLDHVGHLTDPAPYPRSLLIAAWASGLIGDTLASIPIVFR